MRDLWTHSQELIDQAPDLEGFDVDAADGHVGTIDEATYDVGASYLVVDTGIWIFGTRRLVPASAISEIDLEQRRLTLSLTKAQLKDAPDYDAVDIDGGDRSPMDVATGYYGQFLPY